MDCGHCFQPVPPKSEFCPHCGARLAGGDPGMVTPEMEDPTYQSLAQANLLRLRGDWTAAGELVANVINQYPNSATAFSMMGDIHADQQKYSEAAPWYRMALELDPGNVADARKLEAIEARGIDTTEVMPDENARPASLSPFRIAAAAAAVFLVSLIAFGFWLRSQYPVTTDPNAGLRESRRGNGYTTLPAPPAPQTAAPATTSPSPTAPVLPGGATAATRSLPDRSVPTPTGPVKTDHETTLMTLIQPLQGRFATAGLRVSGVQYDQRNRETVMTVDGTGVNAAREDWRTNIQSVLTAAATHVLTADTETDHVTLRLVMPFSVGKGIVNDLAFVGEMNRSHNGSGHPTIPSTFQNVWWHDNLVSDAPSAPGTGGL